MEITVEMVERLREKAPVSYAQAKEFRRRFQEVFGLTRCGDLLRARPGVTERNPASQRLGVTAHCDNMIVTAVEILEQMLQEEPA
jgi:AraC-like DNA-binding protein